MPDALVGSGLRGARLGVVGLGSIGARVAEYASAFGMEVLCATARPDRPRSPAPPVRFAPLTEVLSTADVVTLHLPLTERTRGMLGAAELALMRPGAMLVNTSRGALVDSSALQDALLSGALAGAVLDVTDPEPLPPRSLLLSMANVVVTPHIAAATQQARHIAVIECLEHVRKFLVGNPCCVVDLGGARP
jgi:phosphoglycerate dehydrogenase-like enzyme